MIKKLQLKNKLFDLDKLLTIGFFLMYLTTSIYFLHTRDFKTDPVSEKIALTDAKDIINDNHRWGIGLTTKYKHYPNGPAYALIPFMALGINSEITLRLIPILFSSFSFSFFYFWIIKRFIKLNQKLLLSFVLVLLFFQPGIIYWTKALHEHAYALALLPLALMSIEGSKSWFWLFSISFINGWVGYDFIPSFTVALFSIALFRISLLKKNNYWFLILKKTISKILPAIGGVLLSILLHFIQNALFYSSPTKAFKDLAGSFFVRMGAQGLGEKYNPQYYSHINSAFNKKTLILKDNFLMSRFNILIRFFKFNPDLVINTSSFIILNIILIYILWKIYRKLKAQNCQQKKFLISVVLAGLSGITWHLLMPWHAHFHFFFVYRHIFIIQFAWLALIEVYQRAKK